MQIWADATQNITSGRICHENVVQVGTLDKISV